MRILKQGEEYKEEEVTAPEEDEDLFSSPKKTELKKPVKILIIAVGALLVIAVLGSIFLKFGMLPGYEKEDPPIEQDYVAEEDLYSVSYSEEEREALRVAGYAGDEIDLAEFNNTEASTLLETMKKKREDLLKSEYIELSDAAKTAGTPEYNTLINMTWLGGTPRTLNPQGDLEYTTESVRYNARYIKLPLRGAQCFIELTMEDGQKVFMDINPVRFMDLLPEGNIVVEYNKITMQGVDYIMDLTEYRI